MNVDAWAIERSFPELGNLQLRDVHMGSLKPLVARLQLEGVKAKSINNLLAVIRRVLNKAAGEWIDELSGKPWLDHAPKVVLLPVRDKTPAHVLSWAEQERLITELPDHLVGPAIFMLNTGLRDNECAALRWDWERRVPVLGINVFRLPDQQSKNGDPRIVVLNAEAAAVIEAARGEHDSHVFSYEGQSLATIHTSAYKRAWRRTGLPTDGSVQKGVHNLRHTFSSRLRAANVNERTRSALLGHRDGGMTEDYSAAQIGELLAAVSTLDTRQEGVLLRAVK